MGKVVQKIKLQLVSGDDHPIKTTLFNKVIGQAEVIRKLQFFLNSHKIGRPFPSMLFTGSHGLGKTHVARCLADNMGREFLELNCGVVTTTKTFVEDVLLSRIAGVKPVTILFDEAHQLSSDLTTLLLTILAPNDRGVNVFDYKGYEINYDLSKINAVLATTDSFKIFPALVNRCESIYFRSYSNLELITMLKFYMPDVDLSRFSEKDLEDLAYACRGRGRDTYALSEKIERSCEDKENFTVERWKQLKSIFEINPMGLNAQELKLMRIVRTSGVISCSNIASRMMIGESNVSEEIEIRPKELWLITNTVRGRVLTDKGEDYFDNLLKETKEESEAKIKA